MPIKKALKVRLLAGGDVVAESNDAKLWAQVFGAITGASPNDLKRKDDSHAPRVDVTAGIKKFADALGIPNEEVEGACAPLGQEPYLQLDPPYWEAFQKNHKVRGPGAIAPLQVVGTLLALWFKYGELGKPTVRQALVILESLGLQDKHTNRTLSNCSWLQQRDKNIIINPAEISKAVAVASAYCQKQPVQKDAS